MADVGGKIKTSLGRTVIFGFQTPLYWQCRHDFLPLVGDEDGVITGIFHNGLDPQATNIYSLGVTCSNGRNVTKSPNQEVAVDFNPRRLNWNEATRCLYMTKAPLEIFSKVRVWRNLDDQSCIGLLLYYEDGLVECIGQIRWDRDLTEEVPAPIRIQNECVRLTNYIRDVKEDGDCTGMPGNWQRLPRYGTIYWWSGGYEGNAVKIEQK